jgi:sortase A
MQLVAKQTDPEAGLRRFNNFLTILVIGLGLYMILMPLWPQLAFWIKEKTGQTENNIVYSESPDPDDKKSKPIPKENKLVIPQMGLDATVNEGRYASTLQKGLWHRPLTSTPDKGGNTVIVGHRFTYRGPAIFYHLDKLKAGDEFALLWNGKRYNYKVRETRVVEPTAVEIENNTDNPILTLYTCTPMWTAKQRLVVISDLIPEQSNE